MDTYPSVEGFRCGKYCLVFCAFHISVGLDEVVPISIAVIEVYNMVERGVPKYGL